MPAQSTLNTTETFGNYLLLKKIGSGGMAELYMARQTGVMGFERVLAIKRILPHLTEDAEFIQMFINEAKLAAQITHPHVAQVYDFGAVDGVYYMAMEYVMGKSLSYVLSAGKKREAPVPFRHALYITAKIAAGLDHAYRGKTIGGEPLGIIHRDISPQNILIAYNGDVKLVDFGIAKAASSGTHTQTGIIKGKLSYLSPEQAWGKRVDHRSDLFSLGIVLHEMLTGERLFKGENEFVTLERVRAAEVPPPSSVRPEIPKEIDPIVLKALAKNPDDRYATGHALQEALEGIFHQLDPRPSPKDLSDYLHHLFEKEIGSDVSEFKQVTALTKPPVTTPSPTTKKSSAPQKRPPSQVEKPQQKERRNFSLGPTLKGNGMTLGITIVAAVIIISAGFWYFLRGRPAAIDPVEMAPAPAAIEKPVVPPAPVTEISPAPSPAPRPAVEAAPPSPGVTTETPLPPLVIPPVEAPSTPKPAVKKVPKKILSIPQPAAPQLPPPAIQEIKPVIPQAETPKPEPPKAVERVTPPPPTPPPIVRELLPPPPPAVKAPKPAPREEAPLPILP